MARLFIANGTTQVQQFYYRFRDVDKLMVRIIQPTSQIVINDLTEDQVEDIVSHHAKYGMVRADEVHTGPTRKRFAGLCYSVDRAVPASRIETLLRDNVVILDQFGKVLRQNAAIASNDSLVRELAKQNREVGLNANIKSVEMTIQEEDITGPGADSRRESDRVAEGFRINPRAEKAANAPRGRRRSGGTDSAA